jgi:hypothetical protein
MQFILIGAIIIVILVVTFVLYSLGKDEKDEKGIGGNITTIERYKNHTYIFVSGSSFALTHDPDCKKCSDTRKEESKV